jgi:hypothetical protein
MVAQNNITGLNAMRSALMKSGGGLIPPIQTISTPTTSAQRYSSSGSPYMNGAGNMQRNAQFKPSPFYESLEALGKPLEMPGRPLSRADKDQADHYL